MFEKCLELSLKTHTGVEITTAAKVLTSSLQETFEKGNAYGNRLVWTWVCGNDQSLYATLNIVVLLQLYNSPWWIHVGYLLDSPRLRHWHWANRMIGSMTEK